MVGVILAGGYGTRLYPLTCSINKHLLPIFDKPMIYYSLSTLMIMGIKKICIVCNPDDIKNFSKVLGDGNKFGIEIYYKIQTKPSGIPDGLLAAKDFVKDSNVTLILGDNIIYGSGLTNLVDCSNFSGNGAQIYSYKVKNPCDYGVIVENKDGSIAELVEKPKDNISNNAVIGLYHFDNGIFEICESLKPSSRGEVEIVDVLNIYLEQGKLHNKLINRGFAWLDTGTIELINKASVYIEAVQSRQGHLICSPEEIAYRKNYINEKQFLSLINTYPDGNYKNSLREVISK
tara:strand:- start:29560 stop:30426 length:867 start_codon:yes stop_codon:yes gene_type:complete